MQKKFETTQRWREGSVADFLNLSPEEEAYIDLKIKLARGLEQRRKAADMTQSGLARLIKSSQSRVAKMEAGDPAVSVDLLLKALIALGSSSRELAKVIGRKNQSIPV